MILKIAGEHASTYNGTSLITNSEPLDVLKRCIYCGSEGYVPICRNITHIVEGDVVVDFRCIHVDNDDRNYISFPISTESIQDVCEKCSAKEFTAKGSFGGRKKVKF